MTTGVPAGTSLAVYLVPQGGGHMLALSREFCPAPRRVMSAALRKLAEQIERDADALDAAAAGL